jgi:superfamily II DNA or RNA helicase
MFGPVYKVISTKELMDQGSVAALKIKVLVMKYDEITRKIRNKNAYQDEMDFIVTHDKRNKFIRNLAVSCEGNTLVLFQYVEKHGSVLYEMIQNKVSDTRKVIYIHGGTDVEAREEARKIAENEDDAIILASFGVFSTGVNIPSIENVIFASPSKSKIRNLQSIGRGLRLKKGKTHCNLFDIADDLHWKSWKNHTLNHLAERVKTYAEEKFSFKIIEVDLE